MTEYDLLDYLKRILPSEFSELIFRLGVEPSLLSSGSSQVERAIEVLTLLRNENRLEFLRQSVIEKRRSARQSSAGERRANEAEATAQTNSLPSSLSQHLPALLPVEWPQRTSLRSADFAGVLESAPSQLALQSLLRENQALLEAWCGITESSHRAVWGNAGDLEGVDAAVGQLRETLGRWEWTILVLGVPTAPLFLPNGRPAEALAEPLRRVTEWRSSIYCNLGVTRKLLPDIVPLCNAGVIVGRRAELTATDRDRLAILELQTVALRVSTYDSLLDVLRKKEETTAP